MVPNHAYRHCQYRNDQQEGNDSTPNSGPITLAAHRESSLKVQLFDLVNIYIPAASILGFLVHSARPGREQRKRSCGGVCPKPFLGSRSPESDGTAGSCSRPENRVARGPFDGSALADGYRCASPKHRIAAWQSSTSMLTSP